jgi:hypothetical protein
MPCGFKGADASKLLMLPSPKTFKKALPREIGYFILIAW